MPELPSVSPQKLAKALEKTGFILERTTGSHFVYYHPQTGRRAVVPIHSRDIPKGTLCRLLKEAGIDREELGDLL